MPTPNSNLLKEAIADAKAVRATALANAKAALEEAFNQRFSAVFADKLREDSATEASAEQSPVAENADKDPVGSTKPSKSPGEKDWKDGNDGPGGNIQKAGKPEAKDITPNTIPAGKDGGDATKGWSKDNKGRGMDGTPNGIKETSESAEENTVEEVTQEENTEESVEETVTNEDLDEIIRELEAEAGGAPMDDPAAAGGEPAPELPGAEGGESPEEESTEIHSGDTVTISKVEPPAEEPPMGGEEPGAEAPPMGAEAPGGEQPPMEEDIDLNELLASLNEEAMEEENVDEAKVEEEEKVEETLRAELNEAIAQRNEAYETVNYLKTQINEINLLNAKLLYTNKLFKEFGMNRNQKVKVVEAFDLTKNVREVKMTYANWCESLNFGGKAQRRPQAPTNVQMVTEGAASRPVASTKPTEIITESCNEQARRFQKLAGINVKK